jgi:hypothetical protein
MKPFADEKACSLRAPGTSEGIRWCEGMRLALAGVPENFEGKGLTLARGWYGNESRPRVGGVHYNRMSKTKEGLLLNFCPWCGHSIRFDGEE